MVVNPTVKVLLWVVCILSSSQQHAHAMPSLAEETADDAFLSSSSSMKKTRQLLRKQNKDTVVQGGATDQQHRRLRRERTTMAPTSSAAPSPFPSAEPSAIPSSLPTSVPSNLPSYLPSTSPSWAPSETPSQSPSMTPTTTPPTDAPSTPPSSPPSSSLSPSATPSASLVPTSAPSAAPSSTPTESSAPTGSPAPTTAPTTSTPTVSPTVPVPTTSPTLSIAPTAEATALPTAGAVPVVVALQGFAVTVAAQDNAISVPELTVTLEDYLTTGMAVDYPTIGAVTLQQTRRRRQLQEAVEDIVVEYSGFAVFFGEFVGDAPPVASVQALQLELLQNESAVQEAVDANPAIGQNVRIEKVVVSGGSGNPGDDDDNIGAIVGGVVGGAAVVALLVGMLLSRRRSDPLDGDEDASLAPPPPPEPQRAVPVAAVPVSSAAVGGEMEPETPDMNIASRIKPDQDMLYSLQSTKSASADGGGEKTTMVPGVAAIMRTSTPNKKQDRTGAVTPSGSIDSDDMDGYSLGSEPPPPPKHRFKSNDVSPLTATESPGMLHHQQSLDESLSDNESLFTYNNVGSDMSVVGISASILSSYKLDKDELDGHVQEVEGEPPALGITKRVVPKYRYYDNADVAAGHKNGADEDDTGSQPSDEASEEMEQDLDAFAVELEKAKAEAQLNKKKNAFNPYGDESLQANYSKNREAFEKQSKERIDKSSKKKDRGRKSAR